MKEIKTYTNPITKDDFSPIDVGLVSAQTSEAPITDGEQQNGGAVASTDWLDEFYRDNAPMDAGARQAHFERTKQYNAFHDGATTPELKAAIARARIKALNAIKAKDERK